MEVEQGVQQCGGQEMARRQTQKKSRGGVQGVNWGVDLLLVGIEAHALVDDLIASFAPDVKGRLETHDIAALRLQLTVDLRASVAPALAAKAV